MAIPPIFIFLSLCIIISQGTSVNHGSLENVKPVTIMGFNNNLGTYVEYKGQVEIELGLLTLGLDCVMEKFYIYQEWVRSGYKALTKYGSLMEWREIPKQPNLNRLFDTFQQLSSIKQTPNLIRYSMTLGYTDDQLGSQIKQFAESYNVSPTNIKVMTEKLRNLDSELEKQADNLLKQIHCAQFNVTCTLNKILRNKMKEDFNITISDFLKGSAVKIGKLDNNTLTFEYKIPKIDNDQFSIYRLTPIPKVHGNGTIEILDTKTPYVAVNNGTDRYFELHDLENCLKLEDTRFICKPPKVSTIKHTEDLPCGMAAILNQSSVACTSHLVVRQSLWTPLLAPNSCMATVAKPESLLLLCSADGYEQELKINGSGILRIRGDCNVLLGTSVVLRGQRGEWRDSELAYAYLQTKTETATTVDPFQSHVDQVIRDSITKLKEEHIHPGTIVHPYVICTSVLLTILLLMGLLYCHLRPRPRNAVNLNDAYQRLRVHFRSDKPTTTEE